MSDDPIDYLIRRLRADERFSIARHQSSVAAEAADAIEELQAENEQLKAWKAEAIEVIKGWAEVWAQIEAWARVLVTA